MSETKTVNQGWVKLNLPKSDSKEKVRTKKPDWIRVQIWENAGLKVLLHL